MFACYKQLFQLRPGSFAMATRADTPGSHRARTPTRKFVVDYSYAVDALLEDAASVSPSHTLLPRASSEALFITSKQRQHLSQLFDADCDPFCGLLPGGASPTTRVQRVSQPDGLRINASTAAPLFTDSSISSPSRRPLPPRPLPQLSHSTSSPGLLGRHGLVTRPFRLPLVHGAGAVPFTALPSAVRLPAAADAASSHPLTGSGNFLPKLLANSDIVHAAHTFDSRQRALLARVSRAEALVEREPANAEKARALLEARVELQRLRFVVPEQAASWAAIAAREKPEAEPEVREPWTLGGSIWGTRRVQTATEDLCDRCVLRMQPAPTPSLAGPNTSLPSVVTTPSLPCCTVPRHRHTHALCSSHTLARKHRLPHLPHPLSHPLTLSLSLSPSL